MMNPISSDDPTRNRAFAGALTLAELLLVGYAISTHLSIAGQARCDGCAPFHPLFVVAPFAVGVALLPVGGYLLRR
jgi:hypothetical protein